MRHLVARGEKSTDFLLPLSRPCDVSARDRVRWNADSSAENWMSHLDDALPVSALSIPGTHDSAAFTYNWPFVATQTLNIKEQLDSGIRYFDFRLALRDDVIEMVHGSAFLGLQFDVVLATIYEWLSAHAQEGIIVQLKQDRDDENSSLQFYQAVTKTILANTTCWRTANTTPTLGELRGRIQLFRRFVLGQRYAYGINVTQWEDNPEYPFTIRTWHGVQVTIQDHYKLADPAPLPALIASKGRDVSGLLNAAANDLSQWHWYINFTSSFEINLWYQITPKTVATGGYFAFRWIEGINLHLRNSLKLLPGKRRYGIVAMDFPELATDDLIETIIASNFQGDSDLTWKRRVLLVILILLIVALAIATAINGADSVFSICTRGVARAPLGAFSSS
ncbi:PLC-like phosphodiesterase [Polychaeton citri CBS 116435]|uniref:PLC-like phosphodiesterase n=1 Tax=Polychaeton citri CBS 116435 TaxID=1314669 RepID=A0A9P4UPN3_9PEZI|nr:PLC-like phosphodiesterase [Polychaeton citri CBS 116435]